MFTDALLSMFPSAFAVAFAGGGMLYLPSAFPHSSSPQSPSEYLEGDGNDKESLIQGLPCGRLASNGATFEMPSHGTFKTEKQPPLLYFTVGANSNILALTEVVQEPHSSGKAAQGGSIRCGRNGKNAT